MNLAPDPSPPPSMLIPEVKMPSTNLPYTTGNISRPRVLKILETALLVGEIRFARQLSLAWLMVYPGDLPISLIYAQALMENPGNHRARKNYGIAQALPILENLCLIDPEFLKAHELLLRVQKNTWSTPAPQSNSLREINGNLHALGGSPDLNLPIPEWSNFLRRSRQIMTLGNEYDQAEQYVHQALLSDLSEPLIAITHLLVEIQRGLPPPAIRSLAEMYHTRWPDCLQLKLILADTLIECGESERAVILLHQSVVHDVTGQVATRLWGPDHPYRRLWPDSLEAPVLSDLPVPASVAAALGWNRLPSGGRQHASWNDFQDSTIANPFPSETTPLTLTGLGSSVSTSTPNGGKESPATIRSKKHISSLPEYLCDIQDEMEKIAVHLRQPHLIRADGRFPVYVIMTTRQGLELQYGSQSAALIDEAMKRLGEAVQLSGKWGALVFYADEGRTIPSSPALSKLKSKPARYNDPWSIKLGLTDLDAALGKQGEMIGALLIVGGPDVVPFHCLPNPVDDADPDVPSDNPYATRDENYFIPEWPTGRVPGGKGHNPGFLLHALHQYAQHHLEHIHREPWYERWWKIMRERLGRNPDRAKSSLGYTAAIWKRAALTVFRPIGESRSLLISPPVQVCDSSPNPENSKEPHPSHNGTKNRNGKNACLDLHLRPSRLGYFNLHGLQDSIDWYGHRDPFETNGGPDYPIALRPKDVETHLNHGRAPQVVFSEACYGANILDRTVEESIVLKFLASGSQAVVGATCTAYGTVTSPLTAADLLGYSFWLNIDQGMPAGEALRQAKIYLASEMHTRQGYLDGEDQKTLISFVLYGDPLAIPAFSHLRVKPILRARNTPASVKIICDRSETGNADESVPQEVLLHVKQIVAHYLPGMSDANLTFSREHVRCNGESHQCPTAQIRPTTPPNLPPDRRVVTLSKQVQRASKVHHHYARITLDPRGKMVKLVVSR